MTIVKEKRRCNLKDTMDIKKMAGVLQTKGRLSKTLLRERARKGSKISI